MANLGGMDRLKLERLLGMGGGYVLDFSNRDFGEFVSGSTGRSIFHERYAQESGSKAHRLRAFWRIEPDPVVAKLVGDLLDHGVACGHIDVIGDEGLVKQCYALVERLKTPDIHMADVEALSLAAQSLECESLFKHVQHAIATNELSAGLDRLHAFSIHFFRNLCSDCGINTPSDKPLQSLAGEYVKHLRETDQIGSLMAERILRNSISVFDAFNDVRNNQSLAHANQPLDHDESHLIFGYVLNTLQFMQSIEKRRRNKLARTTELASGTTDDMPF